MAEVSIKSHTRRGKNGKTVQVRGYTRRVGRKGVHSPKREKAAPGEEFEAKVEEKKSAPKMSAEELAAERKRIQEWEENFKKFEERRKALGMSREQYSRKIRNDLKKKGSSSAPESHSLTINKPLSPKGSMGILERVEDKIAKFVENYGGGRKYKRQL